jgi:hypothetical protein
MHGARRGQSYGARTSGQTHEECFRQIVAMVSGAEHPDPPAPELGVEKSLPCRPGHTLGNLTDRSFRPFAYDQAYAQATAERGAKPRIAGRGPPAQTMIKVQSQQTSTSLRPMRPKQQQQRN